MLETNEMNSEMMKASVLIEALPYIRRFYGKIVVVKYGGSAMLDEDLKYNVIKDVALLKLIGMKPIIVHGGGKEISKWVKLSGKEAEFYNGLRVTDKETMEIAEMVLNKVNKELVGLMQKMGLNAVGICGKDANLIQVEKKMPDGKDIGYVGNVKSVNTELLTTLMDAEFIPVVAPIGMDENFDSYNINADDAACGVAKAMEAEKLVFLTDIEGVFVDPSNKKTLISEMDVNTAKEFIANGVVGGGMLPKLNNCIEAIEQGVSRVHILDGRVAHCLLLEFFTEKGIGTAILKEPLF
ncbi:MAG TPA: acetylglutamate kinase [Candidatus Anaerobutyricum stercoris]|uniref:Acetylglutamate kinase n=2 Tax=Clostridia TaxID=186801 RepID=A0A9D2J7Y5_9FIRM|nr:acetylglutamate kinase [Eubacterium sp. An3]OUO28552.1 acetylglutamate kinase [Eubacterium sp. An3]CVI73067.1 Acetylglutamate kinase [Eubacteriaceae bacterium CHKCI004]HIZ39457.1 acetylglutamate kinase [Candidatus Anaerobutyricum stercoris]